MFLTIEVIPWKQIFPVWKTKQKCVDDNANSVIAITKGRKHQLQQQQQKKKLNNNNKNDSNNNKDKHITSVTFTKSPIETRLPSKSINNNNNKNNNNNNKSNNKKTPEITTTTTTSRTTTMSAWSFKECVCFISWPSKRKHFWQLSAIKKVVKDILLGLILLILIWVKSTKSLWHAFPRKQMTTKHIKSKWQNEKALG